MNCTVKHLREIIAGLPDEAPVLVSGKHVVLSEALFYVMPVFQKGTGIERYEYSLGHPAEFMALIIR